MAAWFEDFPLDFSRADTKGAEQLLVAAYTDKKSALQLADDSGIDRASIDTDGSAKVVWRDILKRARAGGRLLRLIAEVMSDPEQQGTATLLGPYVVGFEDLLAKAILDYKPSYALLRAAPPTILLRKPGVAASKLAGQLEQAINAAAGFADVPTFLRGLTEAQARTARILVGGQPNGTGFLVADSLLLTNWHVVASGGAMAAQFDYNSGTTPRDVAFAASWNVTSSDHAAIAEELGPDGPTDGPLDFALVRLAEPVGAQPLGSKRDGEARGHIKLGATQYNFLAGEPILIVGHPKTRPLQLSYAAPSGAKVTTHATRVRYQTNTEGGSSGSPVFNKDWRLVALHHGSGPTDEADALVVKDGAFNQGIPIARIVAHLQATLAAEVKTELGIG